jgi:hypothetical protein
MELVAAIKVASTIVPCRIVMPRALRWALTVSTIWSPSSCDVTPISGPVPMRAGGVIKPLSIAGFGVVRLD